MARLNEDYLETAEQTMAAQARMVDAWLDTVDEFASRERLEEDAEAIYDAYDVWMQAAEDTVEQISDVLEGEEVPVERFRDTWLNAANRSFKNAMRTSMFAQVTGRSIDEVMDMRRLTNEFTETALHDMGLPTDGDIEEVGERLVELERRQHGVEERLDRILESLDVEE